METVRDLIFVGSMIITDGDCSHEIKRRLLLGRKAMTNLNSILKSRHITLPTKVHDSQSYGFSSSHVRMLELDHKEGWVLKNWCFQTAVLEKTLESPWKARRSNQSILKEINPEYSLEGLMPKLQYFSHLMKRANSLEKILILGKLRAREGGNRGWDGWMTSLTQWTLTQWTESEQTLGYSEGQGILVCCRSCGRKESDTT